MRTPKLASLLLLCTLTAPEALLAQSSRPSTKPADTIRVSYLRFPWRTYRPNIATPGQAALMRWSKTQHKEIRQYYDAHKANYRAPQRIRVRHILRKTHRGMSAAEQQAVQAKIKQILAQAKRQPSRFAQLAAKVSEGPSRRKGGDLGYFAKTDMVKSFADAAFALRQSGEISPIVKTRYGYHIIQLVAIQPPTYIPFLSAEIPIATRLWQRQARKQQLTSIFQWFIAYWQKHKESKIPLRQMLQQHFSDDAKVGQTPNGVIAFWERHAKQVQYKMSPSLLRAKDGTIEGIAGRFPTLRDELHKRTPAHPVLKEPIWLGGYVYAFRLR